MTDEATSLGRYEPASHLQYCSGVRGLGVNMEIPRKRTKDVHGRHPAASESKIKLELYMAEGTMKL